MSDVDQQRADHQPVDLQHVDLQSWVGRTQEISDQAYPTPARALAATLTGTPTPVVYPAMPVMVKTPAHPVAVLPPRLGAPGGWKVECGDTGICALHVDDNGRLQGFALTGSETGRRNTLVKELAA